MIAATTIGAFALVFTPSSTHYDFSNVEPSAPNGYYITLEQCQQRAGWLEARAKLQLVSGYGGWKCVKKD